MSSVGFMGVDSNAWRVLGGMTLGLVVAGCLATAAQAQVPDRGKGRTVPIEDDTREPVSSAPTIESAPASLDRRYQGVRTDGKIDSRPSTSLGAKRSPTLNWVGFEVDRGTSSVFVEVAGGVTPRVYNPSGTLIYIDIPGARPANKNASRPLPTRVLSKSVERVEVHPIRSEEFQGVRVVVFLSEPTAYQTRTEGLLTVVDIGK